MKYNDRIKCLSKLKYKPSTVEGIIFWFEKILFRIFSKLNINSSDLTKELLYGSVNK